MAFQRAPTQPPLRSPPNAPETVAAVAGLFPGEVAVRLETLHLIGVRFHRKRLGTGAGVLIEAVARWITGTGAQRTEADGDPIMVAFPYSASMAEIEKHGLPALTKEVGLIVLGELPTMVDVPVAEGEPAVQAPMIPVSDEVRLNASIRKAIALAADSAVTADSGTILGV